MPGYSATNYDGKYLSSTSQCIEFALTDRTIRKLLRQQVDIITSLTVNVCTMQHTGSPAARCKILLLHHIGILTCNNLLN
jgi:hypothetical protein